jgi:hypothetical protein
VIDRELAVRKRRLAGADVSQSVSRAPGNPIGHGAPSADGAAERRRQAPPRRGHARDTRRAGASESSVMRDVREVEAGRKRQLGYDKP